MKMSDACDVLVMVTEFGGGGTERYAEDIAIGLAKTGLRVAVAVDRGGLDRVRCLTDAAIPIFNLDASDQATPAEYVRSLRAVITRLRPRIIHANAWLRHRQILECAAACGVPLVFTGHTTYYPPRLREWVGIGRSPFALYRDRKLLRDAAVICISKLSRDNLRRRIGPSLRVTAVYNGVSIPKPTPFDRSSGAPRVIWVGSLIERKRPLTAIEVFLRVLPQFPGARLSIVGDGPLLQKVREAAGAARGSIDIAGFQPAVPEMMTGNDIYLQTSVSEGIAYTVIEAMAAGLPVVATDAGATREAVIHGETGLICRKRDVDGLARSLASVFASPPLRKKFGANGRERAERLFAIERMIDETRSAYQHLCGVDLSVPRATV